MLMTVDLARIGGGHAPGDGVTHDALEQPLALGGRHHLGVADARNVAVRVQHDRAGHDGTGQAAATHLVDAGDMAEPATPQSVLQRAKG